MVVVAGVWAVRRATAPAEGEYGLPGYVGSAQVFERETARFYGPAAKNVDAEEKFQLAAESVSKHDYGGAAALLEEAAKQASLPVIFNDLGVIYAHLEDPTRTVNAFREALARDAAYAPARQNLQRLKGKLGSLHAAFPVTREIEPNATLAQANLITLGNLVDGEISSATDVDWYRATSPLPPRDLIKVEVTNKTQSLSLLLSICDGGQSAIVPDLKPSAPGASFSVTFSALPNSDVYFKVEGAGGTTGAYTLAVRALKAFDAYEPNDQLFTATKIDLDQPIEANIMDAQDADFYTFVSPRDGTVTIEIQNRSTTLSPALTTYTPETGPGGQGPEAANPGEGLKRTLEVRENQLYYLQIASQAGTAGDYTLTIR